VVTHLHARIGDAFGCCRIARDLVADQKEGGLGIIGDQNLEKPVGNGVGPSSKVNATHFARAQSTSSAPTWWRSAATVTTAAVAPITAMNARPDIHHDLLIFGAISPPFHPHQLDPSTLASDLAAPHAPLRGARGEGVVRRGRQLRRPPCGGESSDCRQV
jgi:hypothetical protein